MGRRRKIKAKMLPMLRQTENEIRKPRKRRLGDIAKVRHVFGKWADPRLK